MPDNSIPFSIGLETLPADALRQDGAMGGMMGGGGSMGGFGGPGFMGVGGSAFTGGIVGMGDVQLDGNFVTDRSLKQAAMPMTVFQSFPVQLPDGTYTMVSDQTSTSDGAGTNKGGLSQVLNGGICGCPDGFNESILTGMQPKVTNFKVGASCSAKFGQQYLQYFYPEVQWGAKDFSKMKVRGYICAEVVCPISATEGKVIRVKMVDEGPVHKVAIDIMGAFCMLDSYKDIFSVYGKINGKNETIDNTTYKFPFASAGYDYINGEIPGYGPTQMLELRKNVKINTAFSKYGGSTKGGATNNVGHAITRVRFFIDQSHKEAAEKVIGHPLPEDIFKTNYDGEIVQLTPVGMGAPLTNVDNSTLAGRIINAGIKVGQYCHNNGFKYSWDGRTLNTAPAGSGMAVVAKSSTDCSAGVWWILAEAGFLKKPTGWPPNTVFFRKNFSSSLVDGISVVEVSINQIQPGDIILWDRGRSQGNHIAIYSGPGKCFDFGSTKRIGSIQPVNKGLDDKSAIAGRKVWRVVPAGTAQGAVASEHKSGVRASGSYSQGDMAALN